MLRKVAVLLVEDEVAVAEGIGALLEMEGFAVSHAYCGRDAMPAIEHHRPDVIILDVGLPDMDGIELYRGIAARWPQQAVIFSTGHGDQNKLEGALENPRVAFLQKPYDFAALEELLASLTRDIVDVA